MNDDFWGDSGYEFGGPISDPEQLTANLNPAQQQAVQQIDGPLLVLAGPGSGKTRVITHRIAYMIALGIPSHNILALTFTNKAAEEMRLRLNSLAPSQKSWTGTFHKFCARMLRVHAPMVGLSENFTIYDTGDSRKVIKQAVENTEVDLRHYSVDRLSQEISNLKNRGVIAHEFTPRPGVPLEAIAGRVYVEYQKLLQMANGVDFDDLLLYAVQLLQDNPELREAFDQKYSYFMVDEYQDTNLAQYKLIRLLNHTVQNLAVTGDPDQSIYGWRGANINNILNFEQDYPNVTVVRLQQNYRSTKSILRVADQLIENNLKRKHKSLVTDNQEGRQVRLVAYPSPQEEGVDIADSIALAIQKGERKPSDFAVFYRTNWLSRALEHALHQAGVPYQIVNGHEFYQRKEIKDLIAYLHLLNNPRDSVAFERIINVPPRKIGKITVSRIRRYAMEHGMSLLDAARNSQNIDTISKAPTNKIRAFVEMFDRIFETRIGNVEAIIKAVIDETGYRDWLTGDGSEEGFERARNVDELVVAAQEFDSEHPGDCHLETFLEQTALVSDTDVWESTSEYVTLMTLHAAKGLEFPCVYIVGMEDGILPHERSSNDDAELEEERRLLFVGITRAQQELQMSRCLARFRRGSYWPSIASRFLMELPREEMLVFEPRSHEIDPDTLSQLDPWLHDGIDNQEYSQVSDAYETDLTGDVDISFDVDDFETENGDDRVAESSGPMTRQKLQQKFPRLVTAAELEKRQSEQETVVRVHPSVFNESDRVEHPEYGFGTIERITGQGNKRTATIVFDELGRKRFRLAFVNLTIVEGR